MLAVGHIHSSLTPLESDLNVHVSRDSMRISFRPCTIEEELRSVLRVFRFLPLWRNNGYNLQDMKLSQHPVFTKYESRIDNLTQKEIDDIRINLVTQEYDTNNYSRAIKDIKSILPALLKGLTKIQQLSSCLEFKEYDDYLILLTKYMQGGSFDYLGGKVTIGCEPSGFNDLTNPTRIILHEIIHIGIQESIVSKFQLTHREKERVVDHLCKRVLVPDILDYYNLQPVGDPKIDVCFSDPHLGDLADRIARYKVSTQNDETK